MPPEPYPKCEFCGRHVSRPMKTCPICNGLRYFPPTEEIPYRWKTSLDTAEEVRELYEALVRDRFFLTDQPFFGAKDSGTVVLSVRLNETQADFFGRRLRIVLVGDLVFVHDLP